MTEENKETKLEEKKIEDKKEEKAEDKKKEVKIQRAKKTEAVVNATAVPISTLDSIYICNFIRKKTIAKAIADLEDVLAMKRVIPMKGEVPHRKGKGVMSGRYPKIPCQHFIKLLKTLQANSNVNGLENPIISEAFANMGSRPYGRFGRIRRKRTHIKLKATEKTNKEKKK